MARIRKDSIALVGKVLDALEGYGAEIYRKAGKVIIEIPFSNAANAKGVLKMVLDARRKTFRKGV